jgi:hypothetical protein
MSKSLLFETRYPQQKASGMDFDLRTRIFGTGTGSLAMSLSFVTLKIKWYIKLVAHDSFNLQVIQTISKGLRSQIDSLKETYRQLNRESRLLKRKMQKADWIAAMRQEA